MMIVNENESGDAAFVRLYQANQEKLRPVLDSLRQLHARPPERVDYNVLMQSAQQALGIASRELSGAQTRHLLYLLARHYGQIELDPVSCELAGVNPFQLTEELRGSTTRAGFETRPEATAVATDEKPQKGSRRHGMPPDMARHQAIERIVSRHAARWREDPGCWKPYSVLGDICADLDAVNESDDGVLVLIPDSWRRGKTSCVSEARPESWREALLVAPRLVKDHIRYSLKGAATAGRRVQARTSITRVNSELYPSSPHFPRGLACAARNG
jgi:hypothetical protein